MPPGLDRLGLGDELADVALAPAEVLLVSNAPVGATETLILDYLAALLRPPGIAVQQRWSGCYALSRSGASMFRAQPAPGVQIVTGTGRSGMTRSLAIGEQTVRQWGQA